MTITLPRKIPGRPSKAAALERDREIEEFCEALKELDSTRGFKISVRGWCYILEEHGLVKGDFTKMGRQLGDYRKACLLPIDFFATDETRTFDGEEVIWHDGHYEAAQDIMDEIDCAHTRYTLTSFWEDKDVYIMAMVEKIDLKNLFAPVLERFCIPYANTKGWGDLNNRAKMMCEFRDMEEEGKKCVLLYFGDHDPGGLQISDHLRSNMEEIAVAVGWSPANLIIDRFGLNYDFIEEQGLTWIDNLETANGKDLASKSHKLHNAAYVQDYLKRYGARKCEANALVTRIDAGRELCLQAILKYLNKNDPAKHESLTKTGHEMIRDRVVELMTGGDDDG